MELRRRRSNQSAKEDRENDEGIHHKKTISKIIAMAAGTVAVIVIVRFVVMTSSTRDTLLPQATKYNKKELRRSSTNINEEETAEPIIESRRYCRSRRKPIPAGTGIGNKIRTAKHISLLPFLDNHPPPPVQHETHWVVPGRILAGSSPGDMNVTELLSIIRSGIDTFVNLQRDYFEYVSGDYRHILREIATKSYHEFPPYDIQFLHCPIPDLGVLPDNKMLELIEELLSILEDNNRSIYIHCYGGHGRTGMVLVNLLQAIFGVNKELAMYSVKRSHTTRACLFSQCALGQGELELPRQEDQVKRLEGIMHEKAKAIKQKHKKSISSTS